MIKKIYKPISIVLTLLIVIFTFSACSKIDIKTITNNDNTIDEIVTIELDETEIVNAGYSLALLKLDIQSRAEYEVESICNEFDLKIENDLQLDLTDETKEILNSYKGGIVPLYSEWNNNVISVGIRFSSIDVYKYYYNITEEQSIKFYVEEHFFYNKLYYYANTKYVAYNTLFNKLYNIYAINYSNLIESESNQLTYTYITDYRREHSDADFVNKINGKYYHTWIIDENEIDKPIMIYYNVANIANSILVCLLITAAVTIILLIIGLIKINIKKFKNNKKNNKIT